ncbi:MAG: hypothetical protein M1813_007656 [Trichoglossum hirsutum]|nr:MAG: hypothetical protein M1813_007656 [Trichoglossum hirsutum]
MVLSRATAFRSLLRSSAIRTSRAGSARQWGQTGRREYASGGHGAKNSSSDLPWLIGSIAITAPSSYWLLQQGPDKAHHHDSHSEKHEGEHEGEPDAKGKSEDTTKGESDRGDESKQDTPDTSDDETEAVKFSGEDNADGSTAQNIDNSEEVVKDKGVRLKTKKIQAASSQEPDEGKSSDQEGIPNTGTKKSKKSVGVPGQ